MKSEDVADGANGSQARGVSADGSVVVGDSNGGSGPQAFRWTLAGGMVGLGNLPGGSNSTASTVSPDGTLVGGNGLDAGGNQAAFLWDSTNGLRDLKTVLTGDGYNLTGWTLQDVTGISADDRTITGYAINPAGNTEAFSAILPEPGMASLPGVVSACALLRRRRAFNT